MYERLFDLNVLYKAYKKAHRSKTNSLEVVEFDKNKINNLIRISKTMESKQWDKLFNYYRFFIHDPKERKVDALRFEGRIVQHALCDEILRPYFEQRLIKENAACRENKGTDYARNHVKRCLNKYFKNHSKGYVLKIDIRKYFDSIDHEVLKNMLNKFPDEEIRELLFYIVDHTPDTKGIPIGNQTSQWFALAYVDRLDRIIKEKYRIKYYCRYMDDFIIIHESRHYLRKLLEELRYYALNSLKLEFNEKTQITPLKNGFSFLGWRYNISDTNRVRLYISKDKRKRKIKKLKKLNKDFLYGLINHEEYSNSLRSHVEDLSKGNTYYFMKRFIYHANH